MKYCTSCGKELNDRAKFCTGCGTKCAVEIEDNIQPAQIPQEPPQGELPNAESACREAVPANDATPEEKVGQEDPIPQVEPEQQSEPITPPVKKKKPIPKGKIILFSIIGVVLVVVITAAVLLFRWYTSTEQQVLRALDAGDYDTAVVIMEKDASANESKSLADQLNERITNIKTGFVDGTIEYASAMMELDTIEKLKVDGVSAELNAVQIYIDNLNESRTNFATAESFYTTGDYAEAIANYRLVIEDDANYAAAVEKLTDAVNKYRDAILAKAKEYADAELYSDAVALLNEALEIIPNDTKITEQIRIYEKDNAEKLKADALETAAGYAKNVDYLNAFKALTSVMKSQATDAELVSAYNKYCDQYAAQIISEVDLKVSEKDFDGAISLLNTALRELPGNEKLSEKLDMVEAKAPISITSLKEINSDIWGKWNEGTASDPFGNDYTSACNYVHIKRWDQTKSYVEYRLYGKYSTLTGVIAPHADNDEEKVSCLQVYVDDELVYTSPEIGRKTDAISFSVDITGAEYIKIVIQRESWSCSVILSDVQLWP